MNIEDTLAPKSDQLDAVDLVSGPQTFTVERITDGPADQPVNIHLAEFPRPWRPGKNMRRVVHYAWGLGSHGFKKWSEASGLVAGRRVTLYYDPEVRFGGAAVGGVRISHMSHIAERIEAPIIISQGKSGHWAVEPLPEAKPEPTPDELAAQVAAALNDATTEDEVREWGNRAHARQLLDLSPGPTDETLREMVQTRLAALTADVSDAEGQEAGG